MSELRGNICHISRRRWGHSPHICELYKPQELVHFGGCIDWTLKRDNLKIPTENGDDFFAGLAATQHRIISLRVKICLYTDGQNHHGKSYGSIARLFSDFKKWGFYHRQTATLPTSSNICTPEGLTMSQSIFASRPLTFMRATHIIMWCSWWLIRIKSSTTPASWGIG